MCGIAGIIGSRASEALLRKILNPITHRGESNYINELLAISNMAIGAHRLAIVDENGGQQPFKDAQKQIYSVFNGEIYNHHEIREQLSVRHHFTSRCDSEVVLKAYLEWGTQFVNHLDGKFAIAIYDKEADKLILARDHMGIKPLYYAKLAESWVFASELKSFETVLPEIDSIEEIAPGTIWVNGISEKYYHLNQFSTEDLDFDEVQTKNLVMYLQEAVRKRIEKNSHSIACLLSGGIDSTIITYLASQIHPHVIAYTLAAPNSPSSDVEAAKLFCNKFNIKHVIVSPSESEMQDFYLQQGVYMTESFEPVLVRNAVSYHYVCKKIVEDGFKYCLNGEGADELFSGYDFIREAPQASQDNLTWYALSILHKSYLHMADRASMYATLEARVPYMDKALIAYALSLPPSARLSAHQNKVILRQAFMSILPESITNRRKTGMNEGAGFGVNASQNSIYFQAVNNYYIENPEELNLDINLCQQYATQTQVDYSQLEDVYNYAKFIKLQFNKLKNSHLRLQLNTQLKTDLNRTYA